MNDKIRGADFNGLVFPIEFGYETCEDGYVIYTPYGTKLPPYIITKLLNDAYKSQIKDVISSIALRNMLKDSS